MYYAYLRVEGAEDEFEAVLKSDNRKLLCAQFLPSIREL